MRALAWDALRQYPLQVKSLHYLGWFTNLMFRVETSSGDRLVLRICAPGWRTDEDRQAEAAWLLRLASESEIEAPVLQPAQDGHYTVVASAPGVPGSRRCILMSWLPGVNLGKNLNETNLFKMGVLFARLHLQAAAWSPPQAFTTRKMSRLLARDEPDVLFSDANRAAGTAHTWQVWQQAQQQVETAFTRLYSQPGLQVIHNDLWHDNIKLHRGRLLPLDFEDTVWGYPVQDIAMAMQDLMSDVSSENYEPLLASFRGGYESLVGWPESYPEEMDTFRLGRMLWVANYVALHHSQHLNEHLERHLPLIERFLDTGKLRKS